MDITPLVKSNLNIIQSYEGGVFKVSGKRFESSIIVTAIDISDFPKQNVEDLKEEDFDPILKMKDDFDVFLLGTGKIQSFLKPELSRALKQKGLHLEIMDTGAACRTYNVLLAEGRRVMVILLPCR